MFAIIIACLCLVGLYASIFMLRKQARAAAGEVLGPSVVLSPRARAIGVPNSLIGLFYYAAMLALTPFLRVPLVWDAAFAASIAAAAFSLYLAYSLLFVTRLPCAYCWTGHIVNWSLVLILIFSRH
jgi:uncharacterized membrane protein